MLKEKLPDNANNENKENISTVSHWNKLNRIASYVQMLKSPRKSIGFLCRDKNLSVIDRNNGIQIAWYLLLPITFNH